MADMVSGIAIPDIKPPPVSFNESAMLRPDRFDHANNRVMD
jgi:hypothetical protein